jgi:hypothetical protein
MLSQGATVTAAGVIVPKPIIFDMGAHGYKGYLGKDVGLMYCPDIPEFQIEKIRCNAQTRALKVEYTMEIAQDLKAVHGLNAEAELANILSSSYFQS